MTAPGQLHLTQAIAIGLQGHSRRRYISSLPIPTRSRCSARSSSLAPASTAAVSSSCCKLASVARNHDFATSAANDWRANLKSASVEAYCSSALRLLLPDASPQIDFPGRTTASQSLQPRVVAGHLAAAPRQPGDCRPELATRGPNIARPRPVLPLLRPPGGPRCTESPRRQGSSSCASENAASQSSWTAPALAPSAAHSSGGGAWPSSSSLNSSSKAAAT